MMRLGQMKFWMFFFVALVTSGCAALVPSLIDAFVSNPWFKAVILAILGMGVVINFRQVASLYLEIDWIESYQSDDPVDDQLKPPRLLYSMSLMLSGRGEMTLSASSTRTMLDPIRTRLEESRDLSRYFIGVLIFLGLLGTFWGLMATVGSVSAVVSNLAVDGTDPNTLFETFKSNLQKPLHDMGVAFSSSLFGLAGSLVLGFLDLQAAHAQNRFVNELEQWLSSSTRLSSGVLGDEAIGGAPAYVQALLEQTADTLEKMQRNVGTDETQRGHLNEHLADLAAALSKFARQLESQNVRLERFAQSQGEIPSLLERIADQGGHRNSTEFSDELRAEMRLLNKTIANALSARD